MRLASTRAPGCGCSVTVGQGQRAPLSHQARPPLVRERLPSRIFGKHRNPARQLTLVAYSDQEATPKPKQATYSGRKASDDEIVELYKDIGKLASARRRQGLPIDAEEQSMWDECRLCAIDAMDSTTPFRVSNILYRCRMGENRDVELFRALVDRARSEPDFMKEFHPIGISMVIQSMGVMARQAKDEGDQDAILFFELSGASFVKALMEVSVEGEILKEEKFRAKELSNALQGAGVYVKAGKGLSGGDPTVQAFARAVCAEFIVKAGMDGNSWDFNSLLQGCARCTFNDEAYIAQVTALLEMRLSTGTMDLPQRDLANIIWSLGALRYSDKKLMGKLAKRVIGLRLTSGQLNMIIQGLTLVGYRNSRFMLFVEEDLMAPARLEEFTERDLASVIHWLFGGMKAKNEGLLSVLLSEITQEHRLKRFSEQGLASIVFGCQVARFSDENVLRLLVNEITRPHRLGRFEALAFPYIINGFAMMKYPDKAFYDIMGEEGTRPERLAGLNTDAIARMLIGFAKAGHCKDTVFDVLTSEIIQKERLSEMPHQVLGNLVRALEALGCKDERVWEAVREEVQREERLSGCTMETLVTMINAFQPGGKQNETVLDALRNQIQVIRKDS